MAREKLWALYISRQASHWLFTPNSCLRTLWCNLSASYWTVLKSQPT